MKRFYGIIMSIVYMLLISGCQGWFNAVPKDTVMVKKIVQEQEPDKVDYEGVLSQRAAESLGLNAVNKYFGQNLDMEQVQFKVSMIDQAKLKELFKEASTVAIIAAQAESKGSGGTVLTSDISTITKGLYYVTLTTRTVPLENFEIVLNTKDGDVLKIFRSIRVSEIRPVQQDSTFIELANRFIEKHGSYPLSEVKYQLQLDRSNTNLELYYSSKDNKTMRYCVVINPVSREVVGFSKNVLAFFSYTAKQSAESAPSPTF